MYKDLAERVWSDALHAKNTQTSIEIIRLALASAVYDQHLLDENEPTYKVDGWNNFCRVFQLPDTYPEEYCFHGPKQAIFNMVDWFNPVPEIPQPAITKVEWIKTVGEYTNKIITYQQLYQTIVPFVKTKTYIKPYKQYIIICDFGASIMLNKGQ